MKAIKMNKVLIALDYNPTAQKVAEVATNYLIDKFPSITNENIFQKIVKQLFKFNK
jgi:hypothetical protein